MSLYDDMMPTPCVCCGDIVDFNDMVEDPQTPNQLICEDCAEERTVPDKDSCPECMQEVSQEELDMFGGLCEECSGAFEG